MAIRESPDTLANRIRIRYQPKKPAKHSSSTFYFDIIKKICFLKITDSPPFLLLWSCELAVELKHIVICKKIMKRRTWEQTRTVRRNKRLCGEFSKNFLFVQNEWTFELPPFFIRDVQIYQSNKTLSLCNRKKKIVSVFTTVQIFSKFTIATFVVIYFTYGTCECIYNVSFFWFIAMTWKT